jgi:hypothetical protein
MYVLESMEAVGSIDRDVGREADTVVHSAPMAALSRAVVPSDSVHAQLQRAEALVSCGLFEKASQVRPTAVHQESGLYPRAAPLPPVMAIAGVG